MTKPFIESQPHYLANGKTINIHRNGRHQYWLDGNEERMPSVTSMLSHIDPGGFGVGMGWAIKQIKLHNGDIDAPRAVTKAAQDEGSRLHQAIDDYISRRIVDEGNALFVLWLNEIGNKHRWVASEKFLYHPLLRFGGCSDAFSTEAIWDWKTVNQDSYTQNGGRVKDIAQLGAYAMALRIMGSVLARQHGFIVYVMRDGSGIDVAEVNLDEGWNLFQASHHLHTLVKKAKDANA